MSSLPLISVIIPAYNAGATLRVALTSILEQTYPHLEIIVVDDGSTDNTADVVRALQTTHTNIVYIKNERVDSNRINKKGRNINAGWAARNIGMRHAQGAWITFQDADDASLRNRIEAQYSLAQQYAVEHVCVQWMQYKDERVGTQLNLAPILEEQTNIVIPTEDIIATAKKARGVCMALLPTLHRYIPFKVKRARIVNKLFFGSMDPYPGSGNCPLISRRIADKVYWRARDERVWPSFAGRGADRDFNFQIAMTFKSSMSFNLPLYLWRVDRENPDFKGYEKYLTN